LIHAPDFPARHRVRPQDFTRTRTLPFPSVVVILLNLCKNSLQDELDGFFETTRGLAVASRVAWKSALSQARYKLRSSAFEELNDLVIERFYRARRARRWHGLRLLAGDGSTARLPDTDEVLEHFGGMIAATGRAHALARVVSVFDPLNRLTVAAKIAPYAAGERELLAELLPRLGKRDLLLLDRGFPAFWLFALLAHKQVGFCVRASVSYCPEVTAFLASGKRDAVISSPGWSE